MGCNTFMRSQIPIVESQIIAYQDAILALGSDNIQSYSLNTSQSTQVVTRADLQKMQDIIDQLFNRLSMLNARCDGGASTLVMPSW